ncbi:hypothetical protein ACFQZ4_34930 [Catellatospora coxensis]
MTLPPPQNPPVTPAPPLATRRGPAATTEEEQHSLIIGLIVGVVLLCVIGLCGGGVVYNLVNDDSPAASPSPSQAGRPSPSDRYSPPAEVPTTEAVLPAPASVGDCITVDKTGDFLGLGNCNGTRGTYRVLSVDRAQGTCSDPDGPWITTDGYRLCLELYLVRNYCYILPTDTEFAVAAPKCKAKGTVHIIDIVRGGSNGDKCTNDYKWNHWYRFLHPTVVYCVMRY